MSGSGSAVATSPGPAELSTAGPPLSGRLDMVPAATLAALMSAVLLAGAAGGRVWLTAGVGFVQAVLVVTWVLATRLPGRIGAIVLGLAASAAADASALRWYEHGYESALGVLGLALPLMFCHQLVRGVVRTRVVESLSGIAVLLVATCALSGLLLLIRQDDGSHQAAAVAGAVGAALFCSQLADAAFPRPRFDPAVDRGLPGLVVGIVAGGVAAYLALHSVVGFGPRRSVVVGAGTAAVACLLSVGASFAAVGVRPRPRPWFLAPAAAVAVTAGLSASAGYLLVSGLAS